MSIAKASGLGDGLEAEGGRGRIDIHPAAGVATAAIEPEAAAANVRDWAVWTTASTSDPPVSFLPVGNTPNFGLACTVLPGRTFCHGYLQSDPMFERKAKFDPSRRVTLGGETVPDLARRLLHSGSGTAM